MEQIMITVLLSHDDRTPLISEQIGSRSEIDTRNLDFGLCHWPWHVQRTIEVGSLLKLSLELIDFIFVQFVCLLHFLSEVRCKLIGNFATHLSSNSFSDSYFSTFTFPL